MLNHPVALDGVQLVGVRRLPSQDAIAFDTGKHEITNNFFMMETWAGICNCTASGLIQPDRRGTSIAFKYTLRYNSFALIYYFYLFTSALL
jgi:hypothetical protein